MRLAACVTMLCCVSVASAGDLNPPAGPVMETMKPLDEVEPRIAVNAENTPTLGNAAFSISQPGSYYLTSDVVVAAGQNAIAIVTSDVTLDLNGFTIRGVPGAQNGIVTTGFPRNIEVRNGALTDWPGNGILADSDGGRFINLRFENCDTYGINTINGFSNIIEHCVAFGCGVDNTEDTGGFLINRGVIRNSLARSGSVGFTTIGSGNLLDGCSAIESLDEGFNLNGATRLVGSVSNGANASGFLIASEVDATFESCTAQGNTFDGFEAEDDDNSDGQIADLTFINCKSLENGESGYDLDGSAIMRGCVAAENGQTGFQLGGEGAHTLRDCDSLRNTGAGFAVNAGSLVESCSAQGNSGFGVTAGNDAGVSLIEVVARGNGDGFQLGTNAVVERCVSVGTGVGSTSTDGVVVGGGSVVRDCTIADWRGSGIVLSGATGTLLITGNRIRNNDVRAISFASGSEITDNVIVSHSSGIQVLGDSLVMRNRFINVGSPVLDQGNDNVIATVVTGEAALNANRNPNANIALP